MSQAIQIPRIASGGLAATIARAATVHRQIAKLASELDALKAAIRSEACDAGLGPDETSVTMSGPGGSVTVVYVADRLVPVKGADLAAARASVPAWLADRLFAVRVVLAEGAAEVVRSIPPSVAQKALGGLLSFEPQSARVNLPK